VIKPNVSFSQKFFKVLNEKNDINFEPLVPLILRPPLGPIKFKGKKLSTWKLGANNPV